MASVFNPGNPTSLVDPSLESVEVRRIIILTQAEYDALVTKDPRTLYVITIA